MSGTLTTFLCFGLTLGLRNLVLAWILQKPTLWAEPGLVVAKGTQVMILCEGTSGAQDYYLFKYGDLYPLHRMTLMKPGNKAKFLIPFVKWSHAGKYHCMYQKPPIWSEHSDPLPLVVTGFFGKPRLSVLSSPVVTSGGSMTLQCVSLERYESFILTKEDEKFFSLLDSWHINTTGQFQALFHMDPVTASDGGMFRCYGYKNNSYMWSAPSDPLKIHISGELAPAVMRSFFEAHEFCDLGSPKKKAAPHLSFFSLGELLVTPHLSVHPGPRVSSGENVTLLCQSSSQVDAFLLSKEGTVHQPLHLRSVLQAGMYLAKFSMRNVTFVYGGMYKCYSYDTLFPYLLSYPSNPVELVVSGFSEDPGSSSQEPVPTSGLEKYLQVLIGISVVFLLLLFILTILLLQFKHQGRLSRKGSLPKPVLRAQPDSVVSKQTKVTFFCEGTTGAKEYRLFKDGVSYPQLVHILLKPRNKTEFVISNIDHDHAGQYHCQYQTPSGQKENTVLPLSWW
ncbi:leukocyte immunoglobulin-like receptor subfamily B member 3A [Acomys russatus]|uniref:leukocyte immunoglobulin-like receptor subfamily B member 3A n=1 Tax=Acomys russatus TaxID=60746 RepID=UPI0021E1D788|nr:leukocyte immunoglobulin-like receptor subfamily B member 3A [Acomys russatus]